MANNKFPTNAPVQFDGASLPISEASPIARGFHRDACEISNPPVHQSIAQYPANFGCQSSIGIRALGNYSTYNAPAVPSYPRQSMPSASHNAVKQSAITTSIQEHVHEDRNTISQDMNASESVAGIMQGLTGLTLDPSQRELVQPQESSSLAASFAAADSDSGCVQSSGSFPVATAPECAEDRSGSVGDSGFASSSAGSGVLAASIPDAKVEPRIVLGMQKLDAIFCKRTITRCAVAERAASIDLFYSVDEDKDTQLHICLYDYKQYFFEAWNLVAGSRPDWLSIKNNRGFTPLMCAVMYGADVDLVRALSLLSFSLTLADLRGYTALHYAAYLGRLDFVDAMLLEPTQHEYLLVRVFYRDELFGDPQPELSYSSLLARHRAAVATLLASRNSSGETPLFCAVKSSNFDVTARLLAMRADPLIEELSEGKTALILAVQLLDTRIVHALLSHPSPQLVEELVNKRTRAGVSPLRTARRMICCDPQQKADLAEIIARLVGAGGLDSVESEDENDSEHDESMRSSSSSPSPVSDVEGEERAESQHAN